MGNRCLALLWPPVHIYADRHLILYGDPEQRWRLDPEVGQGCGNCASQPDILSLMHQLKRNLSEFGSLPGELHLEIGINRT